MEPPNIFNLRNRLVSSYTFVAFLPGSQVSITFSRYARVWIDGICEPIIELCNGFEPISCVRWCPANSTIITYVTRTKLEIWDIKTNCLLPAASHSVGSHSFATVDECLSDNLGSSDQPMRPNLTVCEFRKCGHSIVVGDESGTTYVFELENIPSPPHFQYEALEQALVKNVSAKPFVLQQITSLGYMGYWGIAVLLWLSMALAVILL